MTGEDRMREALEAARDHLYGDMSAAAEVVLKKVEEALAAEREPSLIKYGGALYIHEGPTVDKGGFGFERPDARREPAEVDIEAGAIALYDASGWEEKSWDDDVPDGEEFREGHRIMAKAVAAAWGLKPKQ